MVKSGKKLPSCPLTGQPVKAFKMLKVRPTKPKRFRHSPYAPTRQEKPKDREEVRRERDFPELGAKPSAKADEKKAATDVYRRTAASTSARGVS